jgi:hypothetical protein
MRRHPTAPVNVARISVATSGTDFTAPEPDFAALIRAAGFGPGRSHLSRGSCIGTAPGPLLARMRNANCIEQCPSSGAKRKTYAHTEIFSV